MTSVDSQGRRTCKQNRVSTMKGNFCKGQQDTTNCAREQEFNALDNQARWWPCVLVFDLPQYAFRCMVLLTAAT